MSEQLALRRAQPAPAPDDMVVYTAATPNGLKVPMALEELRVPWRLHKLELERGDQRAAQFLAINPNGRIPAIIDRSDPAQDVPVFESGAILIHLAERHGGLLPDDRAARASALGWLFLQVSGIGPAFGNAAWFARMADPAQPVALRRFQDEAERLATLVDTRLNAHPWLAGDAYSIADIAHFGWLRNLDYAGLAAARFPAIGHWVQVIEARPATRRALASLGMPPRRAWPL